MSFSDEMKKIGDNISTSYDARIGTLEDIFKDTQSTLKNARSAVKNFHSDRMHMSQELRGDLDHFRKSLTEDTQRLVSETRRMMNGIRKQQDEMAVNLRDELDRFHHTLYKDTHAMLNEFRSSFGKMSEDLRKMLSSYYRIDIKKNVHDTLAKFHSQMNAFANEFRQAHNAWIGFSRSLNAKRGMKQTPKKIMSKSERICNIMQAHPKGMTSGMIAKEMGCSPQSIRASLMNLKKQGKISKRQTKYFCKG